MKRFILIAAVLITFGGCEAEEGNSIQLGGVILPELDCSYKVSGETTRLISAGAFDPSGGVGYGMGVTAYNYMRANDKDKAVTPDVSKANVRSYGNTVSAKSIDVCYYVKTSDANYKNARENGGRNLQSTNCTNDDVSADMFPVYYESVLASGTLPPAKAQIIEPGYISAQVLGKGALRELFGADFDAEGLANSSITTEIVNGISYTEVNWGVAPSPNLESSVRNPAWGEFPKQASLNIQTIIEFRLIGETQDGTEVISNWVTFPIEIRILGTSRVCERIQSRFDVNCDNLECFATESGVDSEGNPTQITTQTNTPCSTCTDSGCSCRDQPAVSCTPNIELGGYQPMTELTCQPYQDNSLSAWECEPLEPPCE